MASETKMPTKEEQKRILLPTKIILWVLGLFVLCAGLVVELCYGIEGAFSKSGGAIIGLVLISYFALEKRDFLTGVPGDSFDAAGHVQAKDIMAFTEMSLTFIGTIVATFGGYVISKIEGGI
ncbi:MAG: hypothetical protein R6V38_01185 [Roseovarius gahaiensis]